MSGRLRALAAAVRGWVGRIVAGAANLLDTAPALLRVEPAYRALVGGLDRPAIRNVIQRFEDTPDFADGRKYLRMSWYLRDSMARAHALGLHCSAPLRILDLGSGAGYFVLACRHLGHDAAGFDLPGNSFYAEMFRVLRLPRVEGRILPFEPVPAVGGPFDLITAYAVTFAKAREGVTSIDWGESEWRYFLADVKRLLTPGGRVLLRLNLGGLRGLRDPQQHPLWYSAIPGYEMRILNRREISLRLVSVCGDPDLMKRRNSPAARMDVMNG